MPTITEPRRSRQRPRLGADGAALVLAAAVVLAIGWLLPLESPRTVDLTVANPTDYHLHLDVGELGVGTVSKGEVHRFDDVVDQGDTWIVRLTNAGVPATVFEIDRRELAGNGWRIDITDEAGRRLQEAGLAPPP